MNLQTKHEEYYEELKRQTASCLERSMEKDFTTLHAEIHHIILDYEEWLKIISSRPEANLFKYAIQELHSSLIAVFLSQYRHAFMSLRLFLELGMATVFYSANELLLRLWYSGSIDVNWKQLINTDNGVFSIQFANAFTPSLSLSGQHYSAIAEKVYRECSEYIHGSCLSFNSLPDKLFFDESTFKDWFEKAKTVKLVMTFALTTRYLGTIDKSFVPAIEPIILDELGHLESVRLIINARKSDQL
jgi:hypothetical protein